VARTVNDEQPSFNFVMTTSCHAPFSVDLESKGLALKGLPPELEPLCECDQPRMLRILGHLRYADQCMGEFVQRMEKTVARPLFVITGDHYGRQFIHAHPTLFERSAVPLILYGKEVLQGVTLPENVAGSHSDIAPTLIEAVAPKGFRYHAMGCNLLEPRERFLGVGADRVIGHDFVAEIGRYPAVEAIPGRRLPADYPDLQEPIRYCHRLQGIAWWRVRKGPTLPEPVLVGPGEE
jgi:phosphoglycerol transferase MdoB-like AlkP superfamily enzyme